MVKIESGIKEDLSSSEKSAVHCLRKIETASTYSIDESTLLILTTSMSERLSKRKKKERETQEYGNATYVSEVAELERLLSETKFCLTENQR